MAVIVTVKPSILYIEKFEIRMEISTLALHTSV